MDEILLSEILRTHRLTSHATPLSENIGDGFLYTYNPLFRNIRDLASKLRISFVKDDFCHYQALSLASLPKILAEKKIYYVDNTSVLAEIEQAVPGQFRYRELVKPKANYLLHEASHCVADQLIPRPELEKGNRKSEEAVALAVLMAESFANANEAMACLDANSELHKIFYGLNSYVIRRNRDELCRSVDSLGFKGTYKLLYFSYLFGNFLFERVRKDGVLLILSLIAPGRKFSPKQLALLCEMFDQGFYMSETFRLHTASFYFKTLGISTGLKELLSFNFLAEIGKSKVRMEQIDAMADFVEQGLVSKYAQRLPQSAPSIRKNAA